MALAVASISGYRYCCRPSYVGPFRTICDAGKTDLMIYEINQKTGHGVCSTERQRNSEPKLDLDTSDPALISRNNPSPLKKKLLSTIAHFHFLVGGFHTGIGNQERTRAAVCQISISTVVK